jgi:DNA-damage-inducible protein J
MSSTVQFSVKIDASLKKDVEDISKRIGLTPSDAVRIFLLQYVSHKGFPFEVTVKEEEKEEEWDYRKRYNAETIDTIERSYDPKNLVEIGNGTIEDLNKYAQEI